MIEKVIIMLKEKAQSQEEKTKIQELTKMLDGIEDNNKICEVLKEVTPDVFKDKEFMLELVSEDENLLKYDETNNPEVYILALQSKRNFLEKQDKDHSYTISQIDAVIQELDNPKEAPRGKYKVPKDILFNLIREKISSESALDSIISSFLDIDCKYPQDYCEKIEKLFFDEENALVMHRIDNSSQMSLETIEDIRGKIFASGLKCYSASGRNNLLSATTVANMLYMDHIEANNKPDSVYNFEPAAFFDFLTSANTVFISVPKKCISREKPIWYSNYPNVDTEHPGFIHPKYVVGCNSYPLKENGEYDYNSRIFIENDVRLEERTEYSYAFFDGETTDVTRKLFERYWFLEEYVDPNYTNPYNEEFCGTPDDRVQCLFIGRRLSLEDIDLLCEGKAISQECKERIYKIDKLLNLSDEKLDKLPNEYKSALSSLKDVSVRSAFGNPIDKYFGDTTYMQLADLVRRGDISNEDFTTIISLGLIPTNLIDPQAVEYCEKYGINVEPKGSLKLDDIINDKNISITPTNVLKSGLRIGITTEKTDEAHGIEKTADQNLEHINKGETRND